MKRKRLSPKEAFLELVRLNDNQLRRLLEFGQKCGGIDISIRKADGDWAREVPLLPVGDSWELVESITVRLRSSDAYAVIRWLENGEVNTKLFGLPLERPESELVKLKAAVDSVLAIVRRGRTEGSGTFPTPEAFVSAAKQAIKSIRARGMYPSEARVAEYFSRTRGLPVCDERQIRRWLASSRYSCWQDLVEDTT